MTHEAPAAPVTSAAPPLPRRVWWRVRPVLAGAAKAALRRGERLLHPWRRRAAERRLRDLAPVREVLVLCYGNICRSPYAAAVIGAAFERRGLPVTVRQGGFFGPGRPANERAQQVARTRGTELRGHSSRLVTADDARHSDLIIVMERWHATRVIHECGAPPGRTLLLGDLDPAPIASRAIPDPYGLEAAVFAATFDRIDRCADRLAAVLASDPAAT